MSKDDMTDEVSSEKLQQKQDPYTAINRSESKEKGSCESMSAEVTSGELQKRLSPDALVNPQTNRDESAHPTTCQEVSGEVQPRKSVVEGIEKLQQKHDPDTGNSLESKEKGSCESKSGEVVSDELHKRLSPDALAKVSQTNRDESAHPTTCQEVLGEVQPRKSVDKGIDVSQSNQEDSSLSNVPEKDSENVHQKKGPEIEGGASESEPCIKSCKSDSHVKEENISLVPRKASDSSKQIQSQKMEEVVSQPHQEQATCSTRREEALSKLQPRRNPDTSVQDLPSDQGVTPSREPEKPSKNLPSDQGVAPFGEPAKPSEDGYNWRKYGQKLVRGNEFTRSYYKCTHLNCLAKKQVERSHDGHITNIHYVTKHEHPRLLNSPHISPEFVVPSQMKQPDMPTGTPRQAEGEKSIALDQTCQSIEQPETAAVLSASGSAQDTVPKPLKSGNEVDNNGGPDSKRRKKEVPRNDEITPPMKSHSEPRHIVQTRSEVDIVNDGYRWRKYGQKFVKGNPNPRSYYRCSSAGCPAKKHVERASHDPEVVVTAYEGQHDHDIPPSRTVTQNSSGADSNTTRISGESTSQSGESKHVGLDRAVHIGAN
ncbi:WRKY transcription factor 1-like isoform X2 [Lycium barbarum]|nr:WRKY transcription factor 1-like isoform X2 [Lycium barbarum]